MSDYQNYAKGSPLEVKVLTQRFGIPNSTSIYVYLQHDGYKALKKAFDMGPDAVINEMKNSGPTAHEVEFRTQTIRQAQVRYLQRG